MASSCRQTINAILGSVDMAGVKLNRASFHTATLRPNVSLRSPCFSYLQNATQLRRQQQKAIGKLPIANKDMKFRGGELQGRCVSSATGDNKENRTVMEPKVAIDGEDESPEHSSDEEVEEKDPTREEVLEAEVKDLKDQVLRSLAEQENTRRIAQKDVESSRLFAVSGFAKSLLETSDNLSRALEAVPEKLRDDKENHPHLANLYEGIKITDAGLTKAFEKHGLKKFGLVGEPFDPHMHDALFEYPDPNLEPGSVGQVMKVGFVLNGRVLRPAEVGVIKRV